MTNYNLEEFKAWLAENLTQQEGLNWQFLDNQIKNDACLAKMAEGKEFYQDCDFSDASWQPYIQIVQKWLAERKQKLINKLQEDNRDLLNDIHQHKQTIQTHEQRILALEADKIDLIQQLSQANQKHQNHLSQEKVQLTKEIQLIKGVIHV